jgi:hypothetical protein
VGVRPRMPNRATISAISRCAFVVRTILDCGVAVAIGCGCPFARNDTSNDPPQPYPGRCLTCVYVCIMCLYGAAFRSQRSLTVRVWDSTSTWIAQCLACHSFVLQSTWSMYFLRYAYFGIEYYLVVTLSFMNKYSVYVLSDMSTSVLSTTSSLLFKS